MSNALLTSYRDFASLLLDDGVLNDPWIEGMPRFRMEPVVLSGKMMSALYLAGETMVALHDEAARLCASDSRLVEDFFDWPATYWDMWLASRGAWHGVARADVFRTQAGPMVCELNCDTPSGQAEAVALGRAFTDGGMSTRCLDPNRALAERIGQLVEEAVAKTAAPIFGAPDGNAVDRPAVGVLYPTELTEDLCVIEQHVRWFAARGFRVVLGSPFNLQPDGKGGVALFGVPCPVIYRHYKTDWWGERRSPWRAARPVPDCAPIAGPLTLLLSAIARGRCAVINPFGAVLAQNKRTMALMWEEISRFSSSAQDAIRRYIPLTLRLESLPLAQLKRERWRWVLKADYGAEGEEVILGAETTQAEWSEALDLAAPRRWVVQRRFEASRDEDDNISNYGVYVVGGRACGLFTRLQRGSTDRHALSAATLVRLP
jgi:glutathionylspermidine synthase